ncbi:hypothetical protein VTL71DRAFT_4623 [Oculimacula yallundae]|uniref:Uncharacterized protein n=1 Tax=Oculimacula yallundae TaxID=86028 RepID=A0ABR4C464_9HELO
MSSLPQTHYPQSRETVIKKEAMHVLHAWKPGRILVTAETDATHRFTMREPRDFGKRKDSTHVEIQEQKCMVRHHWQIRRDWYAIEVGSGSIRAVWLPWLQWLVFSAGHGFRPLEKTRWIVWNTSLLRDVEKEKKKKKNVKPLLVLLRRRRAAP